MWKLSMKILVKTKNAAANVYTKPKRMSKISISYR